MKSNQVLKDIRNLLRSILGVVMIGLGFLILPDFDYRLAEIIGATVLFLGIIVFFTSVIFTIKSWGDRFRELEMSDILEHPRYSEFLREDPANKFLDTHDLPTKFQEWLHRNPKKG